MKRNCRRSARGIRTHATLCQVCAHIATRGPLSWSMMGRLGAGEDRQCTRGIAERSCVCTVAFRGRLVSGACRRRAHTLVACTRAHGDGGRTTLAARLTRGVVVSSATGVGPLFFDVSCA